MVKLLFKAMRDDLVKEIGEDNFNANSASKNIQSQIDKLNKMFQLIWRKSQVFIKLWIVNKNKNRIGLHKV